LDVQYIDAKYIDEAKVTDKSLYTFILGNEGCYLIKTELFDYSKYCTVDSDVFLLSEGEFELI